MNEEEAIIIAKGLEPLDRLSYYMEYFCNCVHSKITGVYIPKTFQEFCDEKNIIRHDVGDIWQERGFASQKWVNLSAGSLFHSVYHNIKLNP